MRKLQIGRRTQLASLISTMLLLSACGGGGSGSSTSTTTDVTPAGHTVSDSEADSRAESLVAQMTLAQKISLVHGHGAPNMALSYIGLNYPEVEGAYTEAVAYIPGISALGIPDNNMVDTASGVMVNGLDATALPSTVGLASSWNPDLARQYGRRIGIETRALGFTTALGGGINLIRDPRNGRGFEYMGEDPILAGEMVAQRTIGIQSQQVMSTIKHIAFNDYETNRYISNSVVDEQTMRETELLGFEIGVTKGSPSYLMCAFNQLNGTYACENQDLLNNILKDEWGYQGMVVSDWGATASTINAANHGLDEEEPSQDSDDTEVPAMVQMLMGGPYFINALSEAVTSGEVPMSRLNDMVFRKVRTMIATGVVDNPPTRTVVDETAGEADAKTVADQSMVLLKNAVAQNSADTSKLLPLSNHNITSIAVIGMYADSGVLSGGGSGGNAALVENQVQGTCGQLPISPYPSCPNFIGVSPLAALKAEFPNATINYVDGTDTNAAIAAAAAADVTVVFGGQWLSEGTDKSDLNLDSPATDTSGIFTYDQNALIEAVAPKAKRTVVVLETGGPVAMPWLSKVDAVLEAWYPGVRGAYTIADILSGDVNPSGKLPVTFPASVDDLVQPTLPTNLGSYLGTTVLFRSLASYVIGALGQETYDSLRTVNYDEKLAWNGYKWMDSKGLTPLFPFGYGLSYSSFDYSNASATVASDDTVTVTFTLTNSSDVAGTEIGQVYATLPSNVPGHTQPPKKLVGWSRVELAAGESKTVSVSVPKKYLSTWDAETTKSWVLTPGTFTFTISNSADTSSANTLTTSAHIAG